MGQLSFWSISPLMPVLAMLIAGMPVQASELKNLVDKAMDRSLDLRIAEKKVELSYENRNASVAGIGPKVDFTQRNFRTRTSIDPDPKDFVVHNESWSTIHVEQPIWDADLWNDHAIANSAGELAELERAGAQQKLTLLVVEAYLESLRLSGVLAAVRLEMMEKDNIENMMKEQFQRGLADEDEIAYVNAEFFYLKTAEIDAIRDLLLNKRRLAYYVRDEKQMEPSGLLNFKNLMDDIERFESSDCLKLRSLNEGLAEKEKTSSYYRLNKAKTAALPKIALYSDYTEKRGLLAGEGLNNNIEVGVSLTLNLFASGRDYFDYRKTFAQYAIESLNVDKATADKKEMIDLFFVEAHHLKEKYLQTKQNLETLRQVYAASRTRYLAGDVTLFEFLLAKKNLFASQKGEIELRHQLAEKYLELRFNLMLLDRAYIVSIADSWIS